MEMEHFIESVRRFPCLWNTTAIEYRDQELKDAAWSEVMKETDLSSVKEVKLKWKKLRDSYRDALKRQSEMLAKEPGAPPKKTYPWKYMAPMQFLQPHMNVRKKVLVSITKKLRDSYRDALKRQSEMLAKEPGAPPKKTYPWKYMAPMQFLQPHMNVRKKVLVSITKKLRDSYRDALKRQSEMLAKEPGAPPKKTYPWKYMAPMQFLQPHMNVRKKAASPPAPPTRGAAQRNGDARSSEESESEPESEPKRKSQERLSVIDRKLDYLCKQTAQSTSKRQCTEERRREPPPAAAPDSLDIFFNSMCQSTKRLPYSTQIKIKKTLFSAVIEAEEALVAEQHNYASLWARARSSTSSDDDAADDDERKAS